jgi:hypothetical protein
MPINHLPERILSKKISLHIFLSYLYYSHFGKKDYDYHQRRQDIDKFFEKKNRKQKYQSSVKNDCFIRSFYFHRKKRVQKCVGKGRSSWLRDFCIHTKFAIQRLKKIASSKVFLAFEEIFYF